MQERVYEYLGDAIAKENEVEMLYDDLLQYENDINNILLEKISIETENKRMKKMISASEKKISAIGNRLIHAAKEKSKDEQHTTSDETLNKYQRGRGSK